MSDQGEVMNRFIRCVRTGRAQDVADMIRDGVNVNATDEDGMYALYAAVTCAYVEIVELLIDAGAKMDIPIRDGLTPLHFASSMGSFEVVKILVDRGADVNVRDISVDDGARPLHLAAFRVAHTRPGSAFYDDALEALKYLAGRGGDVEDIREDYPALYAVALPYYEKFLLTKSGRVNDRDSPGVGL